MVREEAQKLELKDQLRNTLEEARMVLPGIQALFGFQLVVIFQPQFEKALTNPETRIHLLATGLSAIAAAMAIAPASLQRRAEPDRVTESLLRVATCQLALAMWPLSIAVALDFGLLARVVLKDATLAWSLALGLFAVYLYLWVIYPRLFGAKTSAHPEHAS
jgi:hypothetical protein